MSEIMQYLKGAGERLDSEIAANTGLSLANVRLRMSELSAKGEIILCHSIRYVDGKKVEGTLCRIAGYMPPASPGRKPKPRTPVA